MMVHIQKESPANQRVVAEFVDGRFDAEGWYLEISESSLRSPVAVVYLTQAEAKIINGITSSGMSGCSLYDLPALLERDVSHKSIHVVRTHIYTIRKKLRLIGESRVSLKIDLESMRYYLAEER
jgi:DNA-binding winged helix-turn-helix (wHTH) protein